MIFFCCSSSSSRHWWRREKKVAGRQPGHDPYAFSLKVGGGRVWSRKSKMWCVYVQQLYCYFWMNESCVLILKILFIFICCCFLFKTSSNQILFFRETEIPSNLMRGVIVVLWWQDDESLLMLLKKKIVNKQLVPVWFTFFVVVFKPHWITLSLLMFVTEQ